ncbi:MAG: GNAT family N-acetyltransferase [Alphaproteobacteria bacterium]
MIMIREAKPDDEATLKKIDASIETSFVYDAVPFDEGFELRLTKVDPPLRKEYSLAHFRDMAPPCDREWVAESDGRIVGFIGVATEARKKRCSVWHFYVDRAHRKRGIGRRLMNAAQAHASNSGATLLWVETQNVNVPAIAAYRALGFELCGLDTALYHGTAEADETALYLARRIG